MTQERLTQGLWQGLWGQILCTPSPPPLETPFYRGQKRHINIWNISNLLVTPVTDPPGRGLPRFVPHCVPPFLEYPNFFRFVLICSDFFRSVPICFQNRSGNSPSADPFCKSPRLDARHPSLSRLFTNGAVFIKLSLRPGLPPHTL